MEPVGRLKEACLTPVDRFAASSGRPRRRGLRLANSRRRFHKLPRRTHAENECNLQLFPLTHFAGESKSEVQISILQHFVTRGHS